MPKINCDMLECKWNVNGECEAEEVNIDYAQTCETYENIPPET